MNNTSDESKVRVYLYFVQYPEAEMHYDSGDLFPSLLSMSSSDENALIARGGAAIISRSVENIYACFTLSGTSLPKLVMCATHAGTNIKRLCSESGNALGAPRMESWKPEDAAGFRSFECFLYFGTVVDDIWQVFSRCRHSLGQN